MSKRLTLMICCASVALLANGQAFGADLPPEPAPPPMVTPPPPPPPVKQVEEKSCIYARLDGGYAFHERPKVFKNGGLALGEEFDDSYLVDAGIGQQGRHGYVISPELGSNMRAAVVTTL